MDFRLTQTNEALELKCEELQRTVDDTKEVLEIERRKNAKLIQQKLAAEEVKITRLRSYARQSNDAVQSESETEEVLTILFSDFFKNSLYFVLSQ